MEVGEYIRKMAEFIAGEIDLPKFKQIVEERVFELRQNPEVNDEKRFLSGIELYLHEAEEGLRDKNEVYANVQFILDKNILTKLTSKPSYFPPTPPNMPYLLSKTLVDELMVETRDLSPVISK